jgi:hypothetical protein
MLDGSFPVQEKPVIWLPEYTLTSRNSPPIVPSIESNVLSKVEAHKLNGFAHGKFVVLSSQNHCVLPPDVICNCAISLKQSE